MIKNGSFHVTSTTFYYGEGVGLIKISSIVIMTDKTSSIVISHSSDPSTLVTFSVTAAR
jgi:glutamine cyclotransferase